MTETRMVETAPGMVFDASIAGREDAPLVLMLHGFGVSRFFWNETLSLTDQGIPIQRPRSLG